MAVTLPESRKEVALRIYADIQAEVPELNPFLKESIIRAIAAGYAGRLFDIYKKVELMLQEFFLQTAQDIIFIQYWGFLRRIDKKAAAVASGFVPFTGSVGAIIPEGHLLTNTDGLEYEVIGQDYEIIPYATNLDSISNDGSTTTVVTAIPHNYSINMDVTIANVTPSTFNGTFTIEEVTDETTFKYSQTLTPGSGTDGDVTADLANAEIKSTATGEKYNLENGGKLTLKTPITNVNADVYVPFDEIRGGADEETKEVYKERVEDGWRNPFAFWNAPFVKQTVLSVPGVTRVWVEETTPAVGDVTIYAMRDNDDDPFPSPGELQDIKDVLLEFKPVDRSQSQIFVDAPDNLPIDFNFTNLAPDSQSMRDAISESLEQFFKEAVNVGQDIEQDAYRCAIKNTVNPETGETVAAFTLASPTGNITVADGELPTLGNINYS